MSDARNPLLQSLISGSEPSFALLRRKANDRKIELFCGPSYHVADLSELADRATADWTVAAVPYRQIVDLGFDCIDDARPIVAVVSPTRRVIDAADLLEVTQQCGGI